MKKYEATYDLGIDLQRDGVKAAGKDGKSLAFIYASNNGALFKFYVDAFETEIAVTVLVSRIDISAAHSYISEKKYYFSPINNIGGKLLRFDQPVPSVKELINSIVNAYSDCENRSFFERLINTPTDSVGIVPAQHLAALALSKNFERLEFYLTSLQKGDRLGFVPYITEEYISRALEFARDGNLREQLIRKFQKKFPPAII